MVILHIILVFIYIIHLKMSALVGTSEMEPSTETPLHHNT